MARPREDSQTSPNYTEIDGIRYFDGTNAVSRWERTRRSRHFRQVLASTEAIFTELTPCTLTAKGILSNVEFDERVLIKKLPPPTGDILSVGCNFGVLPNPDYEPPEEKKRSVRGRKKKAPRVSTRAKQGTGDHFNSSLTFKVQAGPKQLKIKSFRTGGAWQVTGILDVTMQSLARPMASIARYFESSGFENVRVLSMVAVMRNYKNRLLNDSQNIHLGRFQAILEEEKNGEQYTDYLQGILSGLSEQFRAKATKALGTWNPMGISKVQYNSEKCLFMLIKFYRPTREKPKKETCVKIMKRDGKINYNGGISGIEVLELYHWLNYMYLKHRGRIIFDVDQIVPEAPGYSDQDLSGVESIYDGSDTDSAPVIPRRVPRRKRNPLALLEKLNKK